MYALGRGIRDRSPVGLVGSGLVDVYAIPAAALAREVVRRGGASNGQGYPQVGRACPVADPDQIVVIVRAKGAAHGNRGVVGPDRDRAVRDRPGGAAGERGRQIGDLPQADSVSVSCSPDITCSK